MNLLEGKIAIVTGASRGIGGSIAKKFIEEGAIVYAVGRSIDESNFNSSNDEFAKRFIPVALDISDSIQIKQLVLSIRKKHSKLDILVNNAGVEFNELIGMISTENMKKMFTTNVFAPIELIQYCSRIMNKGGSIINISSKVGLRGNPGQLVYSATKGAVIALTKSAAKELASKNIRVNSIAPGLTNTARMQQADPDKLKERINNIAMGRLAEPTDIANACLFFASDLSNYVSGQVLEVDGCTIM